MRDPTFSRFGTIPACDGQRDGWTDSRRQHNAALAMRRALKTVYLDHIRLDFLLGIPQINYLATRDPHIAAVPYLTLTTHA